TDFTPEEAAPLAAGLNPSSPRPPSPLAREGGDQLAPSPLAGEGVGGEGDEVSEGALLLNRVLYWTGGHPYMTQRLCRAIADQAASPTPNAQHPGAQNHFGAPNSLVDNLCRQLFLSKAARDSDDNLAFVRNRLLRSEADPAALLDLYGQIRAGKRIK